MSHWIDFPRREGRTSRQAHCDLPNGSYEREIGREGFAGPASHLYHRHPPTSWSDVTGPLRPRAYDCNRLPAASSTSPWASSVLLRNAHIELRFWKLASAMSELARNADGDQLLFVHQGAGEMFCDYGHLCYSRGDYLLLPRGTQWRLSPCEATELLMVEASGASLGLPDRGLLGAHALFDPACLDTPVIDEQFIDQQDETPWTVSVKRCGEQTQITYPFNPLDALGWKGTLCPVRLNCSDIRPVISHRYHLPPSVHTSFVSERFMISTFCPRPLETDPGALKVPFFHSNDDYEEVIFYHRGDFFSRDNIHPGAITYHPYGIPHGPHPGAYRSAAEQQRSATDEIALMLDIRDALEPCAEARAIESADYVKAWGGMSDKDPTHIEPSGGGGK